VRCVVLSRPAARANSGAGERSPALTRSSMRHGFGSREPALLSAVSAPPRHKQAGEDGLAENAYLNVLYGFRAMDSG
jgi:hypothetical protein